MKRRIISWILVIAFMLPVIPIVEISATTEAGESEAMLTVDSMWGNPGDTVEVNLVISDNPGILGATFIVSWDESLTLVGDVSGEAFSHMTYVSPSRYVASGTNFVWFGNEIDNIVNGSILTLTFAVSESAKNNQILPIRVSYVQGDIIDENDNDVVVDITDGYVRVITYKPGDVTGDDRVNSRDLVRLSQYISDGGKTDPEGYNAEVIIDACDVTEDGRVNARDLIKLSQYISDGSLTNPDGYNAVLKPAKLPECGHANMQATAAKEASCTEEGNIAYWSCFECGKYFLDAEGAVTVSLSDTFVSKTDHKEVVVPGYAATYENEGKTDGVKCSVCGKILVEQNDIPVLTRYEVHVTYDVAGTDTYLQGVVAKMITEGKTIHANPNVVNTAEQAYTFLNISPNTIPGYTFLGWYDGYADNATRVKTLDKQQTGNVELYAKWSKDVYTVTFDSPDVDVTYTWYDDSKGVNVTLVNSAKYTVDTGLALTNPDKASNGKDLVYGYSFVGWSNDDGFIIDTIKPGTTGNITVHANWTSERNRATSYKNYDDPIIIEDSQNGQFLFIYDIGRIDNVPLYPYINSATGQPITTPGNLSLNIDEEYTYTTSFTKEDAKEITQVVADATTRSSGWTLSKEWNDIYSEGSEATDAQTKSEQRVDSNGNVVGGNYFVSNSAGGASYSSTESGASSSSSSKITTDKSFGINTSYDESSETYADAKLSASNTTEVSAGITAPVPIGVVNAGVKNTTTIGGELASGRKDNTALHVDGSYSTYVGTVDTSSASSYYNATVSDSSNWNSTTSYDKSYQTSSNNEISKAIASAISKTTTYNINKALGGAEENTQSVSGTTSQESGYSNSIVATEYNSTEITRRLQRKNDDVGYYRFVMAGTIHVYGVVGYDVATASYYTYTYSVLADDVFEYVDYSRSSSTFDDCENGLVTFEIPYEVNEYILGVLGGTPGIEALNGKITGFEAKENFDGTVLIPQYYSEDNLDGTYSAYKVTSFSAEAFRGNTEIETVILPIYVTEIPAGAFEGCTNLKRVVAYGVTSIGENAFKGCTSLGATEDGAFKPFSIDNKVTYIGANAFAGVPEVAVMAFDSAVVDAVISSGAKKITVDLSKLTDSYNNKKVVVSEGTEYFALIGGEKRFSDLRVESRAAETFISNITFADNKDTPLKFGSQTVTLTRVNVEGAPGFALILDADHVSLKLNNVVCLETNGINAVLSKNVTLSKASSGGAELSVKGKYLVCGEITNSNMLKASAVEKIDEDAFNSYCSSITVTFNANDGIVSTGTKTVYYGQLYGTLPVPTRDNYSFSGWYTERIGGMQITSQDAVTALVNQTLYAHWTPKTFTIYFDANGGSVSPSSKSVTFGDSIGAMPTPTIANYTFTGWYDANGNRVYDTTVPGAAVNFTVFAHWAPKTFTVYYNANGGSVSTSSKVLTFGESFGNLPTPTKDYHNFVGWYTTADSSGTRVTSSTTKSDAQDITLYAHWELKPEKGWVLASQVPNGAQISKREYRYIKSYYTTSGSSTMDGWIHHNTTSEWSDYGAWSSWQDGTIGASDSRQVETQTVEATAGYHEYRYGRRHSNSHWTFCKHGQKSGLSYTTKYSDWSTTRISAELPSVGRPWGCSICNKEFYEYNIGSQKYYWEESRYIDPTYKTQYRYRDRSLIYTYHFYRTENLTSSSYPSGNDIANIQEWVKYREK